MRTKKGSTPRHTDWMTVSRNVTLTLALALTCALQWLQLALSKGPKSVGVSPEDGRRSSFRNVVFLSYLDFLTMDKVLKPGGSEVYSWRLDKRWINQWRNNFRQRKLLYLMNYPDIWGSKYFARAMMMKQLVSYGGRDCSRFCYCQLNGFCTCVMLTLYAGSFERLIFPDIQTRTHKHTPVFTPNYVPWSMNIVFVRDVAPGSISRFFKNMFAPCFNVFFLGRGVSR
jgi:hypothetical protein